MKKILIAVAAAFAIAAPAEAKMIYVAKVPLSGGSSVFEIYDDAAMLPECQGLAAGALIAKIETPTKTIGYGTGCWSAAPGGKIRVLVKSFDDGVVRQINLSSSQFTAPQSSKPSGPTGEAKRLIAQADVLDNQCRGGSGDNPKTMQACEKRDATVEKVISLGWCWGPDEAVGANKGWVRCQ